MSGLGRRALLGTMLAAPALAQPAWPNRPIRFISPFAPGGPQEVPARLIAEHLSQRLGQPVVIESKPGAGSAVGTQFVARETDGHTFLFTTTSFATLPAIMKDPGFDPFADLVPVTLVSESSLLLAARADAPFADFAGLLAAAKARPGRISVGSASIGSSTHLSMALLQNLAGIELLHVPYRGVTQSLTALLSGDIDLWTGDPSIPAGQLQEGKMRPLAVTTAARSPALPECAGDRRGGAGLRRALLVRHVRRPRHAGRGGADPDAPDGGAACPRQRVDAPHDGAGRDGAADRAGGTDRAAAAGDPAMEAGRGRCRDHSGMTGPGGATTAPPSSAAISASVSRLRQHAVRIGREAGRQPDLVRPGGGEADGAAEAGHRALGRVDFAAQQPGLPEMRVLQQPFDGGIGHGGDFAAAELHRPFGGRALPQRLGAQGEIGVDVAEAGDDLLKRGSSRSSGRPIASKKAKACASVLAETAM